MSIIGKRLAWDTRLATAYDRTASAMTETLYSSLRETLGADLFQGLAGGGLILDAGCGPGRFMARLAQDAPQATVVGLDFSSTMIGLAAARLATLKTDRCHLIQGDTHHLPFTDGSFEAVISTCVLKYWTTTAVACLNEMHRVGKPHAAIILVEMNPEATKEEKDNWKRQLALWLRGRPLQALVRQWLFEHILLPKSLSISDLERLARSANFSSIDIRALRGCPFIAATMRKSE